MKKIPGPTARTLHFVTICAAAALLPFDGAFGSLNGPDIAQGPAFESAPADEGAGRFEDNAVKDIADGGEGAATPFQPSGRMNWLFRSIMEAGSGFPATLCELIENSYSGGSYARLLTGTGAGFSELLSDEDRLAGTGLGYELGPGLRVQGFGIFDMDGNSAFAGPALTYNLLESIGLTTGVQMPLGEPAADGEDFFFAEIRVLF